MRCLKKYLKTKGTAISKLVDAGLIEKGKYNEKTTYK